MSGLSFEGGYRGACAWELTIGTFVEGAFANGVNLVGRNAEGDARS